ncbi:hypothetical protein QBC38DRAFT_512771 [Podospora fimiseda]|uniref:Aminoglycoside phosphotransferase domain-containing protein n=1 Tax=Podospora fimiseda TaxID=252190 RepID=A0AAN6YQQ3_9PEZI|nr:hypothetical protein QBC38DRAFT_512771 [Podospora fimiseda]
MAAPQAETSPIQGTFLLDDSDAESAAPTDPSVTYGAEPFATFRNRIHELTINVIWPNAASDQITIERLTSGGYNRTFGITWDVDNHKLQHVVRVPWFADDDYAAQVAPLDFVAKYTKIPTAKIIQYDTTTENPLESPYMIQDRVSGVGLASLVDNKIPPHGWQKLAKELGDITRQMMSTRSTVAGTIVLSPDGLRGLHVAPFRTSPEASPAETSRPYTPCGPSQISSQSVASLLINMFEFQRQKELDQGPYVVDFPGPWHGFITMTKKLEEMGYFQDVDYCLCHLNLFPRNVIVDPSVFGTLNKKNKIAAILDWDSALLAPTFMACRPPAWLWNNEQLLEESFDESETKTKVEPSTEEGAEIKRIFDEAAGETYMFFAYNPVYKVARRLFQFGMTGISRADEFKMAHDLWDEWGVMKEGGGSTKGDGLTTEQLVAQAVGEEGPQSHPVLTSEKKKEGLRRNWKKRLKKRCIVM